MFFFKKIHTVIFIRQERDCRFLAIRQTRRQTEEALCYLVVLLQMTKGLKKLPLDFWGSELGDVCLSSIYFITLMDRHLSRKKDSQDYVYMPGNFKIFWSLSLDLLLYCIFIRVKGQLNSEWIYEVIVCPKIPTKNFRDFCPGSLLLQG